MWMSMNKSCLLKQQRNGENYNGWSFACRSRQLSMAVCDINGGKIAQSDEKLL